MILGDLLLMAFFLGDMLYGYDFGIDLFMVIFLGVDMLLSVDYISKLHKQSKETNILEEQERLKQLRRTRRIQQEEQQLLDDDAALAEEIRRTNEAEEEIDPEELADLIQKKDNSSSQSQHG